MSDPARQVAFLFKIVLTPHSPISLSGKNPYPQACVLYSETQMIGIIALNFLLVEDTKRHITSFRSIDSDSRALSNI